jgi:hypothetical protein
VNGDGFGTSIDTLLVINELNRPTAEGESMTPDNTAPSVTIVLPGLQTDTHTSVTQEQSHGSAPAVPSLASAEPVASRTSAERPLQGVGGLASDARSRFLSRSSDWTVDESLESLLDEIADDVWAHWSELQ